MYKRQVQAASTLGFELKAINNLVNKLAECGLSKFITVYRPQLPIETPANNPEESDEADPVSYTHLDVYKRQAFFRNIDARFHGENHARQHNGFSEKVHLSVQRLFKTQPKLCTFSLSSHLIFSNNLTIRLLY